MLSTLLWFAVRVCLFTFVLFFLNIKLNVYRYPVLTETATFWTSRAYNGEEWVELNLWLAANKPSQQNRHICQQRPASISIVFILAQGRF